MSLALDTKYINSFVNPHELSAMQPLIEAAHQSLSKGTGLGNDFLGWVDLPTSIDPLEVEKIKIAAKKIRKSCDILIVIGIGGSYLGARAAIEFIKSPFHNQIKDDETPEIYFAGNSISSNYLTQIIELCKNKDVCVNVISKSGTTTEPALAFRIFRKMLIEKYGEDGAKERIFCTTDKARGTLKSLADDNGYETFVIPDDVGGRFSVLTPVGLLPIAVAGCDIDSLIAGAVKASKAYNSPNLSENQCYQYAAIRNIMLAKGKAIEVLVSYEPSIALLSEWYKQLFGESEGKDQKGIYPSSMIFSTDLHSLGQFVQDGSRNIFETVINIENVNSDINIESDPKDFDGMNFLAGMNFSEVNQKAMQGTVLAHVEGGVPNLMLNIPDQSEETLGQLFYFFEKACAISGYLLGVNPFDQPGVEAYKKNMFALLGKPGYESLKAELEAKL